MLLVFSHHWRTDCALGVRNEQWYDGASTKVLEE